MSKVTTARLIKHKIKLLNNRMEIQIMGGETEKPSFRKNMAEHKTYFLQLKKLTA